MLDIEELEFGNRLGRFPLHVGGFRVAAGETGIGIIAFDPCPNRPATGDFLSATRANLEAARKALHER